MNTTETILGSGSSVSAVCANAELEVEALALLEEAEEVPAFLDRLCEDRLFADAVAFLAHALPPRQAVGWAWVCARDAIGDDPSSEVAEALEVTRAWIKDPTDEVRRAAFDAADRAGMATPAGAAGLAAFFSGDSLAPPDSEPAPPPEGLVGRTVAGCVHMSAVWDEPDDPTGRYEEYVRRGIELADRVKLWEPPPAIPDGS